MTNSSDVLPSDDTNARKVSRSQRRRNQKVSRLRLLVEWLVILTIALLLAFLIRTFVFQTFYIPSVSMQPTLQVGDRIIVSKLSTEWGGVHRGDIIVFRRPPAEQCGGEPVADLVKRVIGLPGETITNHGNTIYINGHPLREQWNTVSPVGSDIGTVRIPEGEYFMMGDNRPNSCDSRIWGPLPARYIVGKVVFRIWPISRIGHP